MSNAVDPRVNEHKSLCNEIHELYLAKNADYGDSFRKVREEIPNAILVRLSDKLNRLKKLMIHPEEQKIKEESIDDTLMDLANYALLELTERRFEKQQLQSNDTCDFNDAIEELKKSCGKLGLTMLRTNCINRCKKHAELFIEPEDDGTFYLQKFILDENGDPVTYNAARFQCNSTEYTPHNGVFLNLSKLLEEDDND